MNAPHPNDRRVLVGEFFRERRDKVSFTSKQLVEWATVRRPARVARMLALAHHIQRLIDSGVIPDRADAAKHLCLTRARITQLLDLILLAPDVQEAILSLEASDGVEPLSEHSLRALTRTVSWPEQRTLWAGLRKRSLVHQ